MKISYNWLLDYLPKDEVFASYISDISKVENILTAVGLEVEGVSHFESVKGGLKGLVVGEVLTCEKHPNADKLKVTTVNIGNTTEQIVCGAPNVAAGQKVVVAPVGTVLHPVSGDTFTIQKAKIRGEESRGMLCAEDEIGLGEGHDGIIVLPENSVPGTSVSELYEVYTDTIFEIGLTPNRMDAQSHLGVAKDVCAWLSHHTGKTASVVSPLGKPFSADNNSLRIDVVVKDSALCPRYSGVTVSGIQIGESPVWLKNRLMALGLKPISNVVDITNFILHATGQPLHAFDADKIGGRKVIVETLAGDTPFVTLDEKERKLSDEDIMICDGNDTPMCIAGVFGGADSGITGKTKNIFLESAVFNGGNIRKSIFRHGLRTDAAVRFEKGVDISKTVDVLKYAAQMIRDLCNGVISSEVTDIFQPPADRIILLEFAYLRKLSGMEFSKDQVRAILTQLGFEILEESDRSLKVKAPESNPDISHPADVVEEILRISGLDQVPIPTQVRMTPGIHDNAEEALLKEKVASWLTGNGFMEIFTNSITNSDYYPDVKNAVRIINSLSEELDIMRPDMLATALESIAHNINRKNKDLRFFEFGKSYSAEGKKYKERNHLSILVTGAHSRKGWNSQEKQVDIFYLKGIAQALCRLAGLEVSVEVDDKKGCIAFLSGKTSVAMLSRVADNYLMKFSIKQPVFFLDIDWDRFVTASLDNVIEYKPVARYPAVSRDLSMVLDRSVQFGEIEEVIHALKIKRMQRIQMFDLYESDKLGVGKKSVALNFIFSDPEKTLTDQDTDGMMNKIIRTLSEKVNAEIRSNG
ncbi:MAG: phenylalanine--tRNA ligase subunit beta [Chitinophagaceae bacterium]|nr:phenylalanine--tRNA ligase subunit beta [Chitinophagaceae bacterium]